VSKTRLRERGRSTNLRSIKETLDLYVEGSLDEVGGLDGTVGDQSSVVSLLEAVLLQREVGAKQRQETGTRQEREREDQYALHFLGSGSEDPFEFEQKTRARDAPRYAQQRQSARRFR
jgi:hypothetical protein